MNTKRTILALLRIAHPTERSVEETESTERCSIVWRSQSVRRDFGRASHTGVLIVLLCFAVCRGTAQQEPTDSRKEFTKRFVAAAVERTHHAVRYVSEYVRIPYPGGDVPADTGVCTDEIIRSYRAVGIDLQKEVHEDMVRNFSAYPNRWGRTHPDSNIDHRRVPNLMIFFRRKGESLPVTNRAEDYGPGDLVTWDLGRGVPHIGIVVDQKSLSTGRLMIVHNIGDGPKMEDVLFDWKITGHYRYFGPHTDR